MSECVVRMEKPHDGLCDLALPFLGGTFCAIGGYRCNYCDDGVIPKWCPIIFSLPEWHGDLIDRDVLLQTFQNADYETYNDYCEAFDTTEAAETIVPAEAERSET